MTAIAKSLSVLALVAAALTSAGHAHAGDPVHGLGSSHNPIIVHPVHGPASSHDPIICVPGARPGSLDCRHDGSAR